MEGFLVVSLVFSVGLCAYRCLINASFIKAQHNVSLLRPLPMVQKDNTPRLLDTCSGFGIKSLIGFYRPA